MTVDSSGGLLLKSHKVVKPSWAMTVAELGKSDGITCSAVSLALVLTDSTLCVETMHTVAQERQMAQYERCGEDWAESRREYSYM